MSMFITRILILSMFLKGNSVRLRSNYDSSHFEISGVLHKSYMGTSFLVFSLFMVAQNKSNNEM